MPSRAPSTRTSRPLGAAVTASLVIALVAAGGAVAPSALSAPGSNKVTICHRTHSVTNPYRMITVSASAADGAGRNDHTSHNLAYELDGLTYPVFDPDVDYPSNAKHWGDIIPPVRNGDGLNWNSPGAQAIYTGAGEYFGLCGRLSAKQYFDLEVAAGVDPAEVLADLDEQSSIDDEALKAELGIADFTELDPAELPAVFDELPTAPRGARPPASFGAVPGKQKVTVFVWYDLDRDGTADDGELPAPGVTVSLGEVLVVAAAGPAAPSTLVMAAGDYVTDADGQVTVDTIEAGQWTVAAQPPAETEVTYDSEGAAADGEAQVDVPADSAGFAWVGLVPAETTTDGGPTDGGTDGGTTDGGTTDGGTTDGGGTDGGTTDDGGTDGGTTDDGGTDGGTTDDGAALAGDDRLASTGASSTASPLLGAAATALLLGSALLAVGLARGSRRRGRRLAAR